MVVWNWLSTCVWNNSGQNVSSLPNIPQPKPSQKGKEQNIILLIDYQTACLIFKGYCLADEFIRPSICTK